MPQTQLQPLRMWIAILPILMLGCGRPPSDERLVELSQRSCDRQAEQNDVIACQTQQATELSDQFLEAEGQARQELLELQQQLVEADAAARQELTRIQQDLVQRDAHAREDLDALQAKAQATSAAERSSLDRQREDLENERRQIASERQRAPLVAAAITQVGLVLACLLPLLLCGYLLYVLRHAGDDDEAVMEVLVRELVAERPTLLLPAPPAATERPALPCGETEPDSDPDETEPGRAP